jgi:GR25 family glycosyltransferase involved in LPS biosynthesis
MKYTIMHINDRAKKQVLRNKNNLKSFEYLSDIVFFDANKKNAKDEIIARGISVDTWNPYDGRKFLALPGEYGHWLSTLNVLDYIVKNKISNLLVLEDDARLKINAQEKIINAFNDLPKNWDFLSLHYNKDQNKKSKKKQKLIQKLFTKVLINLVQQ